MSAIKKELCSATGIKAKDYDDEQGLLKALVVAVGKLKDADWDELSGEAQDWYNGAADNLNTGKGKIEGFPDEEKEEPKEEAAPARRRRAAAEEEEPTSTIAKVKEGDKVVVKTKKGKVITGTVTEVTEGEMLVVDDGDGELEFSWKTLEAVTKANNGKAEDEKPTRRRAAEEDDEPKGPVEPQVGDKVKVVTKRGKTVEGVLEEIDDDVLVIDDGEGPTEFSRDRLESVTVVAAAKGSKAKTKGDEEEAPARRRGAKEDDEKPAPRGKGKADEEGKDGEKKRSTNEGGVSIGTAIREAILDDLGATEAEIGKVLTKQGVNFRENTLKLNYTEVHKLIKMMRERKMLKA